MAKLTVVGRFGIVPIKLLNDKNVSAAAKGIYCYIQSKPDGWDFSSKRIANEMADSDYAVRKALSELEKSGWLERVVARDEHGRDFKGYDYVLHETPNIHNLRKPDNVNCDVRQSDFANCDFPNSNSLSNIYSSKKELSKKEEEKPPNPQRGNRVSEKNAFKKTENHPPKQAALPPNEKPIETTYGDDDNYHLPKMMEELIKVDPDYKNRIDKSEDYPACRKIAYKLLGEKEPTLVSWAVLAPKWADFLRRRQSHQFYSKRALRVCKSHLQEIMYDAAPPQPPQKISWDVKPTNSGPIKW